MRKELKFKALFLLILIAFASTIQAQNHDHDEHDHDLHYEHPANEIGIGNLLSYITGEQGFAYGLHLHYLRTIKESRFSFGFGYEQIFDEHKHRVIGVIGSYRPLPHTEIAVSPGILLPNTENPQSSFVLHSEVGYEFEIGHFHLGPTIDIATTFDELHLGAGIHVGYAF